MATLPNLAQMNADQLRAIIAQMQASPRNKLSLKVTEKGGVSCYGLGRFPVTLYLSQWERLLGAKEEIAAFIEANRASLATKD